MIKDVIIEQKITKHKHTYLGLADKVLDHDSYYLSDLGPVIEPL